MKVDLKVLPANDNPQTASSWSVIRAAGGDVRLIAAQSIDVFQMQL